MKTYVYYNLHKHCWSLMQKGRVIGHVSEIVILDAEFRVRQGGRKRVLEQRRKNVHAFVVGKMGDVIIDNGQPERVSYNPYKAGHFVKAGTEQRVNGAGVVWLKKDRSVWAKEIA